MHPVGGLGPHPAGGSVNDITGDLLSAMGRQAVEEDRVWCRGIHEVLGDPEGLKGDVAPVGLSLLTH